MRRLIITALLAATVPSAVAAPAMAQSYGEEQRWRAAQDRYQRELNIYQSERDRYFAARDRDGRYGRGGPPPPPPPRGYDPVSDYRDAPGYQERRMSASDQVYEGSDGRAYCKRSDGTTGLIVGAAAGGILGNVIDGGRHRTGGTLIGGALGALAGKSIDQNSDVRCK